MKHLIVKFIAEQAARDGALIKMTRMAKNYLAMQMHGLLMQAAVHETIAVNFNIDVPEEQLIPYLILCLECHWILDWLERHPSKVKPRPGGIIVTPNIGKREQILTQRQIKKLVRVAKGVKISNT